jgi:hypothetical protein
MERSLALFTIEAAVFYDRLLYLDGAIHRTAKQAAKEDANW